MWSGCDRVKPVVSGCSRGIRGEVTATSGSSTTAVSANAASIRAFRDLFLAIDALGVDPEEDIHAVSCPLGDQAADEYLTEDAVAFGARELGELEQARTRREQPSAGTGLSSAPTQLLRAEVPVRPCLVRSSPIVEIECAGGRRHRCRCRDGDRRFVQEQSHPERWTIHVSRDKWAPMFSHLRRQRTADPQRGPTSTVEKGHARELF